jgi:hypothetical protein
VSTSAANEGQPEADKLAIKIAELISHAVISAAEDLGLDARDPKERFLLLCMLAWGLYGGRSRGRAKEWTDEKYLQLLTDVNEIQSKRPELIERAVCDLLIKGKWKHDRHAKTTRTLLRQLQEAKRHRDRKVKIADILSELTT